MDIKRLQHSDLDFWTLMETRWRDMDSLSHINHAAYLSYMESARVDVYIQLGYSGIRREMDESTILASMEVQIDQHLCVKFAKNKNLICSAIFKLVAYSYKDECTIPVPELIRERCRPIE